VSNMQVQDGMADLMLVEDHQMIRDMVGRLLSDKDNVRVTASVGSLAEASIHLERTNPDVIITDIVMPDGSGVEWARGVKCSHPSVKIIFLTALDDTEVALAAIGTGAEGFVMKNSACEVLLNAVDSVAEGGCAYDPAITTLLVRQAAETYTQNVLTHNCKPIDDLSFREQEIAEFVARGMTNKEIAEAAYVSINTVKTHLRRIYQRLSISSRRELVRHLH
jgi:DNA-binding NarL/FixJ family response regulator